MNMETKRKNEKPSSNFQELIPDVDQGNKAVKKPEDEDYTKDEPHFKNPAKKREREEQPVESVKKAPDKGV
ncbi:hypothetical protein TH53_06690 [Pedobacter lusitanus]|uniref:Uncharacterized protein n=2 Tax=Pedobacter lusitanus TaxID=1503925 RepID=A0A0D0FZH0_9SPHI|nr:hypothetical protein TH53_06690 [Pedobacter lusitanus]